MRATLISIIPVALLVAACGRGDRQASSALSDDLKRDLAAASASGVELASASHVYQPTRFVSAIEQPGGAAPARRATVKRPVPHRTAAPAAPEVTTPDPAPEPEVVAPQQVAVTPEQTPTEAPAPEATVIAPRPTPMPASYPGAVDRGTRGSAGGIGTGDVMGGIIGVIIRGGNGGIDHCDPRTDGRARRGGGVFYPGSARIPINPIIGAVIGDRMPSPRGGIFHR